MSETSPSISTVSSLKAARASAGTRRRLLVLAGIILAVGGLAAGGLALLTRTNNSAENLPTGEAVRGAMTVSITASGEVKAEESEVITNPTNWSVVIQELAPEGNIVEEGHLIIRMECEELDEAIVDQELRVRSAGDDDYAATNKLLVTRKTTAAKVEKARQTLLDAKADLEKYEKGEWPLIQQPEADSKILLAEEDLKLADRKLTSMREINKDPALGQPYSDSEVKSEELKVKRMELNLETAKAEKRILEEYTHRKTLQGKQAAVTDAELNLETTQLEAQTDVRLAEAAEESAKLRLTKAQDRLKELQDQASKLTVVAKKRGLVVYETRRRPWDRPINVAVGEKIDGFRQLMIIPNMKTLQVDTRVYEADRERVVEGQPVRVSLPSRPGEAFPGVLAKVAPLPDTQNPWLSPGVKQYVTIVKFADLSGIEGLKPGATAKVEIIVAELQDVLSVPIAGVFAEGETPFCYRVGAKHEVERVQVQIGQTSESRAQIVSGLQVGDRVLLAPPPGEQPGRRFGPPKKEVQPEIPRGVEEEPTSRPRRSEGTASQPRANPSGEAAPQREGRTPRGDRGGRSGRTQP